MLHGVIQFDAREYFKQTKSVKCIYIKLSYCHCDCIYIYFYNNHNNTVQSLDKPRLTNASGQPVGRWVGEVRRYNQMILTVTSDKYER